MTDILFFRQHNTKFDTVNYNISDMTCTVAIRESMTMQFWLY